MRACPACVLHRSRGATTTAWAYPPDHTPALCARHHQAAADPRHTTPLDIRALPTSPTPATDDPLRARINNH